MTVRFSTIRIIPLLAVVLLAGPSFAEEKQKSGEPGFKRTEGEPDFTVEVDPAIYPKKAFERKGVNAGEMPGRVKRPDALPHKRNREEVFARVPGLAPEIAKMDELDRDLLFVRARTKPLKELAKSYPAIGEKMLARLQKELGAK